ncbi:dNA polymerase III polC-type [Firmicutes bacterium CAG:238]|nr:dNA polymerase III polC-type [Firmicutes bacterium CAG:238]
MFFYEYEYENGYNWKRVYYNVPDAEEVKDSLQRISTICREELKNMYLDQSIPQSYLKYELDQIRRNKLAVEIEILFESLEIGREKGYTEELYIPPFSGTLTLFLLRKKLGLPAMNPLPPHYRCDLDGYVKFDEKQTGYGMNLPDCKCPRCGKMLKKDGYDLLKYQNPIYAELEIPLAPSVHKIICSAIAERFRRVKPEKSIEYRRILYTSFSKAEIIGNLRKRIGPVPDEYEEQILEKTLKTMAEELTASFEKFPMEPHISDLAPAGIEEMKICDFQTLVRLYCHMHGNFGKPKCVSNLTNPLFFVTKEELADKLLSYGVPKHEVFRLGMEDTYIEAEWEQIYDTYQIHPEMQKLCNNLVRLVSTFEGIWSAQLQYQEAWYQIHYPKEYEECSAPFREST